MALQRTAMLALVVVVVIIVVIAGGVFFADRPTGGPTRPAADTGRAGVPATPSQPPGLTIAYRQTRDFRQDAGYAHEAMVACSPRPSEPGDLQQARLRIEPEAGLLALQFPRDLRNNHGRFVAEITNVDTGYCHLFGIEPNETAYMWIGRSNGPGSGEVRFFTIKGTTVEWVASASFREGDPYTNSAAHPNGPPQHALANWGSTRHNLASASLAAMRTTEDAWISCEAGCCIAEDITRR